MKPKAKKMLKVLFKILLSLTALYLIFRKVDIEEVKASFLGISVLPLLTAFFLYNVGQVVSSFRLNLFFRSVGAEISEKSNLTLYYIGMFYNLFLPGGLGGDGYKVYYINKISGSGLLRLSKTVITDRLAGLSALTVIFAFAFPFSGYYESAPFRYIIVILAYFSGPAVYYLFLKLFFKEGVNIYLRSFIYSCGVQGVQALSAIFLSYALGIGIPLSDLISLFMLSSVAAAVPVTFGGVGSRELVFFYGFNYLGYNAASGISFTLLFFLMNAVSSLPGGFFSMDNKKH